MVSAHPTLEDIATLRRQGRLGEAERALRQRLEREPEDAAARAALGSLLLELGRVPEAQLQLERACAIAPDRADYQVLLGGAQWRNGRPEAARRSFEAAIRLDPNAAPAYTALARLAAAAGDRREAELNLRLALRAAPDFPDAMLLAGMLASERGEHEEALRLLAAVLARHPGLPTAHLAYGQALLRRGTAAFAEQAFRRALELAPELAQARHGLAEALLAQGRAEEAVAVFGAAPPEDRAGAEWLGRALFALGRFAELAALLAPWHRREPGGTASELLAAALYELGRHDEAIAVLQAWHEREPQARALYALLVQVERARGNLPGVRSALEYWLALAPEDREAEDELIRLLESLDPEAARARLAEARARRPEDPFLALVAARLTLAAGASEAAEAELLALLERDAFREPRAASALHRALGACRHALGKSTEAAAHWFVAQRQAGRDAVLPLLGPLERLPAPGAAVPALEEPAAVAPLFVAFAPGVALEQALAVLADLGIPGLLDRLSAAPRADGLPFYPDDADPAAFAADLARRYPAALGAAPEGLFADLLPVLDARWLPLWQAALPRSRLLILTRGDPRDAFLNWLAAGDAPHPPVLDDRMAAVWLYQALAHLDGAAAFPLAFRLDLDAVIAERAYPSALAAWLGREALPPPARLAASLAPLAGMPRWLPAGSWRAYATPLAAAFSVLAPDSPAAKEPNDAHPQ